MRADVIVADTLNGSPLSGRTAPFKLVSSGGQAVPARWGEEPDSSDSEVRRS